MGLNHQPTTQHHHNLSALIFSTLSSMGKAPFQGTSPPPPPKSLSDNQHTLLELMLHDPARSPLVK